MTSDTQVRHGLTCVRIVRLSGGAPQLNAMRWKAQGNVPSVPGFSPSEGALPDFVTHFLAVIPSEGARPSRGTPALLALFLLSTGFLTKISVRRDRVAQSPP